MQAKAVVRSGLLVVLGVSLAAAAGCTRTERTLAGAGIGGASGAVIGNAVAGSGGAIVGGVGGAVVGGAVGHNY
ncbi:hypothetical protein [Jiella sp. M17.18]|uniref:hypothetical protein n=1 Tax=Jiella sp. M17.18 TaxID=3234247 RepID=UPI0034DF57EE